jgi:hypothetical protein
MAAAVNNTNMVQSSTATMKFRFWILLLLPFYVLLELPEWRQVAPVSSSWAVQAFSTKPIRRSKKPTSNKKESLPTLQHVRKTDNAKVASSQKTPSTTATTTTTIGEAIQQSTTVEQLLQAASQLWLPTDDDLPSHLQQQQIHHEKRLRWSSQLLYKLGDTVLLYHPETANVSLLWNDPRLERALWAAAIPFQDNLATDRVEKEGRYLKDALCGMHCIVVGVVVGSMIQSSSSCTIIETTTTSIPNLLPALEQLFWRAEHMATSVPLPSAVEMRWACGGIRHRLERLSGISLPLLPTLDQRVENLPFDILPGCIDWQQLLPNTNPVQKLIQEIPFQFDTIVTRNGASVRERRGTAWIAEPDIGALAYSGKLMSPKPISPLVRQVMTQVETCVLANDTISGPFFDCALCNHYPDGDSASRNIPSGPIGRMATKIRWMLLRRPRTKTYPLSLRFFLVMWSKCLVRAMMTFIMPCMQVPRALSDQTSESVWC